MTGLTNDTIDDIWERFNAIRDDEQDENLELHVLFDNPDRDPSRPLVIVVHPGDAVEPGMDESHEFTGALGDDLDRWLYRNKRNGAVDAVVLHRFSSDYIESGGTSSCSQEWAEAVIDAMRTGSTLYSDRLEETAAWIAERYDVGSRSEVYMTGAYADPESGCITAIGTALQKHGAKIVLSECAPSDYCSTEDQWDPEATACSPSTPTP